MKKSDFLEKIKDITDDGDIDTIVAENFKLKPEPHADDAVTFKISELTDYTEKIINQFKEKEKEEEGASNAEIYI